MGNNIFNKTLREVLVELKHISTTDAFGPFIAVLPSSIYANDNTFECHKN